MRYERVVVGDGSDAVRAAVAATREVSRIALISTSDGVHSRITSLILRQSAERLIREGAISRSALRRDAYAVARSQIATDHAELARLGIDRFTGNVQFINASTLALSLADECEPVEISADQMILACGTEPAGLGSFPFDGRQILSPEQILQCDNLPKSMIVIGAGSTGLDHAIILAMLGIEVTVVDEQTNLFQLCGGLIGGPMITLQSLDIALRLGEEVIGIERRQGDDRVSVRLASGRRMTTGAVLVCCGKVGRTAGLNLEAAGVGLDEHGRIWCDANGTTWVPTISAVGDVIGFRVGALAG